MAKAILFELPYGTMSFFFPQVSVYIFLVLIHFSSQAIRSFIS